MNWVKETFAAAREVFAQTDRTVLIPLVSFIALLVKNIFHVEIPQEMIDQSVDGILALVVVIGILTDYKAKKKKRKKETPPV